MRIATLTFVGSMAALALLTAPVQAKDTHPQKTNEPSTSSTAPPCHAYQQAPDGSWTQLPCEEVGSPGAQTQHKSPARNATEETH